MTEPNNMYFNTQINPVQQNQQPTNSQNYNSLTPRERLKALIT